MKISQNDVNWAQKFFDNDGLTKLEKEIKNPQAKETLKGPVQLPADEVIRKGFRKESHWFRSDLTLSERGTNPFQKIRLLRKLFWNVNTDTSCRRLLALKTIIAKKDDVKLKEQFNVIVSAFNLIPKDEKKRIEGFQIPTLLKAFRGLLKELEAAKPTNLQDDRRPLLALLKIEIQDEIGKLEGLNLQSPVVDFKKDIKWNDLTIEQAKEFRKKLYELQNKLADAIRTPQLKQDVVHGKKRPVEGKNI